MVIVVEEPTKTVTHVGEPAYPHLLVAAELIRQHGHANMWGARIPGYTRDNHPLCLIEAIDEARRMTGDWTVGYGEFAQAVVPDWEGHQNQLCYWNDYRGKDQVIEALERVGWLGK